MTKYSKYSYSLLLIILTFACSTSSDKNDGHSSTSDQTENERTAAQAYFEDIFLPAEQGVFRNVSMDLPLAKIQEIESEYDLVLSGTNDDFLQYEKDLSVDTTKGIDYVEIKYIFDDADRLDIVTVNYYIQDSTMITSLYDHINISFIDSYGDYYIDSDGYTVWESSYKRADTIDVTYDIGIRKYVKLNDPGITIELMRFGSM